jgi:hypothetical protein
MRSLRIITITACIALLATAAAAQQRPLPPAGESGSSGWEQRDEARRQIEAIRIGRMTERLRLDEKTAVKFIPAIMAIGQQRRTHMAENRQAMMDIRHQLDSQSRDDAELKTAVERFVKSQHEIMKQREREMETIQSQLTVDQQARYIVFQQEFLKEVRTILSGSRSRGDGPGLRSTRRDRGSQQGGPAAP